MRGWRRDMWWDDTGLAWVNPSPNLRTPAAALLYQAVGQARAFRLVQDHFRLLRAAIAANDGALVKTIGDAVMAVFPRPAPALRAIMGAQSALASLSARPPRPAPRPGS